MSDISDYKTNNISEPLKKLSLLDNMTKKKFYFELVSLVYTDSEYSDEEKELIKNLVSEFNLLYSDCKEMASIAKIIVNDLNKLEMIIND